MSRWRGSLEKVEVPTSRLHCLDQELVATVEAKHYNLEGGRSRRTRDVADAPDWPRPGRSRTAHARRHGRHHRDQPRACARSRGPSRDVGADGCSDRFRTTHMILIGPFGQGSKEGFIDPDRHHLRGPIPERLSTTLAEPIDAITPLGLVCPVLDVLLGDWLAVDLLHTQIVIRKLQASRRFTVMPRIVKLRTADDRTPALVANPGCLRRLPVGRCAPCRRARRW